MIFKTSPASGGKGGPRHLAALVLLLLLAQPVSSMTITRATTTPRAEPQFTDTPTFTSAILNSTNVYRKAHNASALTWNATLASYARSYLSKAPCKMEHSGGPFGENLAVGCRNATAAVEAWGDERKWYNYERPGYSAKTGHFTQLVWKATRSVGCDRSLCGEKGWHLVCEYWPPGNVLGAFKNEVDRPKNDSRRDHLGWFGFLPVGIFLCLLFP
ncbi:CAP domain-containing protein [Xylaria bambusicola]|uniref:CAP domain-containing protein n=1 Tax=Xylaria bambusicola TaxID=326684 RepID=UPI002007CF29|nr:CAP domain-containing protein [Xylaria bambusicola]KAI0509090.1 CAP domain-containing protein [Xylaria bambusicola]